MSWLYLFGSLLIAVAMWWVATINRFARLRNLTSEAWSGVDVALKRRHDLIPNLVQVVERYAAHEKDLLERIVEARSRLSNPADVSSVGEGETKLSGLIGSVIATAEAYPELRSSSHFLELQKELANTEDRIAAARRFYNGNARDYRIALQSFPGSLLAGGKPAPEFLQIQFSERLHPLPT
jgi:LemA protein